MEKNYGNDYEITEVNDSGFHCVFGYDAFTTNLRGDPIVGLRGKAR